MQTSDNLTFEYCVDCGCDSLPNCHGGTLYRDGKAGANNRIGDCPNMIEKRAKARRAASIKAAGLPRLYDNKTFENFDATDNPHALAKAKAWAADPTGWLYFFGPVGVGKTHLSCAALRGAITGAGRRGVYRSLPDLIAATMPASKPQGDIIGACVKRDCIIIDDLGAERDTAYALEGIYRLINGRVCDDRPTVIASNLSIIDMGRKGSDWIRIADRIAGMCGPDGVVKFTGESRR